ncbi:hypothetical protein QBC38DRAFT_530591 [Podospora fimiseda]|uniref:Uncharacterized protein n=1 Tax=Podospora fimiseda TaxID=252190 RepID=A0AAN7BX57_9PEZI|nr:hypothetical protein QBC38DRAFT_530591 [Podospora fimiseda]
MSFKKDLNSPFPCVNSTSFFLHPLGHCLRAGSITSVIFFTMYNQQPQGMSEPRFNYSYPRLVRYSCHTIAYGQLRRTGSFDHTRFRKFLREDELCHFCINHLLPEPVSKHKSTGGQQANESSEQTLSSSEEISDDDEEVLGEEGDEIIEEEQEYYQPVMFCSQVIRGMNEGPWYWEHEKAAAADAQKTKKNKGKAASVSGMFGRIHLDKGILKRAGRRIKKFFT